MENLEAYRNVFDGVEPWSGEVPTGYFVDFLGTLTDARFLSVLGVDAAKVGGGYERTALPPIGDGRNAEGWFEAANWFTAAREARGQFVMMTLGACYGAQAVGAWRALRMVNPMPCTLVAAEPIPENYQWILQHFRDNEIDPEAHWLLPLAVSDSNAPVFFPVGSPGLGAQNCYSTNHLDARKQYVEVLTARGGAERAVRDLVLRNTTGITKNLMPGQSAPVEIKLVSAITLKDLLGPFSAVDYLEADLQQSEVLVFPPYLDLLSHKVRRIHIGTHGLDAHRRLHELFVRGNWNIVFSFEPNSTHHTDLGDFKTNDGVLTVRNPRL